MLRNAEPRQSGTAAARSAAPSLDCEKSIGMLKKISVAVLLLTLLAGTRLFSQQVRSPPQPEQSSARNEPQENADGARLRSRFIDAAREKAQLMSDEELREAIADAEGWADSRLQLLEIIEQLQRLVSAHADTHDSARASAALEILKGDGATRERIDELLVKRARIREFKELSRSTMPEHSAPADVGRKELLDDLVAEWQLPVRGGSGLILATIGPGGRPGASIGFHSTDLDFAHVWKHYAEKCGIDREIGDGYLMTGAEQYGLVQVKHDGSRHSTFGFRSDQYTAVVSLREGGEVVFGQLTIVLR